MGMGSISLSDRFELGGKILVAKCFSEALVLWLPDSSLDVEDVSE